MTVFSGTLDTNGVIAVYGADNHSFRPGDRIVTADPSGLTQVFDVFRTPRNGPQRLPDGSVVLPNSWFQDTLQLCSLPLTAADTWDPGLNYALTEEPKDDQDDQDESLETSNTKGINMPSPKKTIAQSFKESTQTVGRQMLLATKQRAAAEASGALLNIGVSQLPEDWQLLLRQNPVALSLLQLALPLALNTVLETSGANLPGQKHLTAFAQLAIEGSSTQAANTLVNAVMPKLEMLAQLSAAAGYAKLLESDVSEPEPDSAQENGPTIDVKAERVA